MLLNRRKYNIYLFDVDGTLLINNEIPESAINSIKELKEEGNVIMLSTGRCQSQLKEILDKIPADGAITNNGAYCHIGKEVLFDSPIPQEIVMELVDKNYNICALTKDRIVRFINTNKEFKHFFNSLNIEEPKKGEKDIIERDKIYSLCLASDNADQFDTKKYKDLRFIRVSKYGFDIVNNNVTKASAFDFIRKRFPHGRIIAFGDNYNDIEMLDEADLSVCMQSSPDECKKVSSFVTRNPEDDGIEFAIDNFVRRVLD